MKKKDVTKDLKPFNDKDELTMGGTPFLGEFGRIFGKGQYAMIYKCVLKPGHAGQCYCGCKRLHFTPDQPNAQVEFSEGNEAE